MFTHHRQVSKHLNGLAAVGSIGLVCHQLLGERRILPLAHSIFTDAAIQVPLKSERSHKKKDMPIGHVSVEILEFIGIRINLPVTHLKV